MEAHQERLRQVLQQDAELQRSVRMVVAGPRPKRPHGVRCAEENRSSALIGGVALGQPVAVVETSVAVTASVILAVSLARRVRRGVGVAAFVSLVTGVGSSGLTNGFDHVRGWQEHGKVAGVLARERLDVR